LKQLIITITIIIALVQIACTNSKKEELPPLTKDKLKLIMVDMHIAEAAAQNKKVTKDSLLFPDKVMYYDQIYKFHKVTEKEFQQTFNYYISKPLEFDGMYDELIKDLSKLEAETQ